jgi:ribonuclease HI
LKVESDVTSPDFSDKDLLRAIYFHCDRAAVRAEFPGLTEDALLEFFRKLVGDDGPSGEASPEAAAPAAAQPVSADSVILYSDGGSRGNPGPAGYGVVMTDAKGNTLGELAEFIGKATNNQAEYQGLIAGLRLARDSGASEIIFRSDSELLVRQINGRYKVKSATLKPLFEEARDLLTCFDHWQVQHVRRHLNTRADALANQAMDLH